MTRKCSDADFEHAIQAYTAGESAQAVAARFHTAEKRLTDALKARGLFRSPNESRKIAGAKMGVTQHAALSLPDEEIINRYLAGESANALAQAYGVSRTAIHTCLRHAQSPIRNQAEANRLLAEQTPVEEHHRRIAIAQEACRGRKQTLAHRCRIAATKEANISHISKAETMLAQWLRERSIESVPQKAIGPYNVDLGIHPVAVEIFGGAWHAGRDCESPRARYILDQGWHLIVVWAHGRRSPITPAVADYIVAFLEELRRDPPSIRQYRVIRGDGQELARGRSDADNITLVVPGYESYRERARDGRSWR